MLPNFFLIGPGRSGTTWIAKSLMCHPDIFLPRRKSTRFFSSRHEQGLDWYESQFSGWRREKAVGEASVGYLRSRDAPCRIRDLIPEAKLIATLRHPVDRAYSSYGRLAALARKGEPNYGVSFEDKLRRTPRLMEEGLYAHHLERWLACFHREQLLILFFEDMKANPGNFLRTIYEFLGVDADFASPLIDQKVNATSSKRPRSRLLYGLYRTMMRLDLFHMSKWIDELNRSEVEPLSREARERLVAEYYLQDIRALEAMTGRDLSEWKTGAVSQGALVRPPDGAGA